MIRCIRIWTDDTGNSAFETGTIDLSRHPGTDGASDDIAAQSVSFRETQAQGSLEWHNAPVRQLVITLSGNLEFETKSGARSTVAPGDVVLAEDKDGSGHRWKLTGADPWRRVYVVLAEGESPHFVRQADP